MSERFSFRFARADWVALSTAVALKPLGFRLATVVVVLSFLALAAVMTVAPDPAGRSLLARAVAEAGAWYPYYLFAAVLALGLFFRHRLAGLNAAAGFGRMPLADRELTVEFGDDDVHVAGGDLDWRFPWTAVSRLIETSSHLIVATGGREGLPIPRTAFPDADGFDRVRRFVLAHLGQGAVHDRL